MRVRSYVQRTPSAASSPPHPRLVARLISHRGAIRASGRADSLATTVSVLISQPYTLERHLAGSAPDTSFLYLHRNDCRGAKILTARVASDQIGRRFSLRNQETKKPGKSPCGSNAPSGINIVSGQGVGGRRRPISEHRNSESIPSFASFGIDQGK